MFSVALSFRYLLHRLKAGNRHGLHSPFVYQLVDSVIYDFNARNAYPALKNIHTRLRNDRPVTYPFQVLQLLYRLVADAAPQVIITLSHVNEALTAALQLAAPEATLYSFHNKKLKSTIRGDLFFIDAAQVGEGLTKTFARCLPHTKPSSLLIIQRMYRQPGAGQSWEEIKAHPQVTVTVDLFWLQLVYFRQGQAREHFRVRY